MAILKNQRHEAFCINVVQGRMSEWDAYRKAGFKSKYRSAISAILARDDVKARMIELRSAPPARRDAVTTPVPVAQEDGEQPAVPDLIWVAQAYADVFERALAEKQFGAANNALAGLRVVVDGLDGVEVVAAAEQPRISINDLSRVLDKVADVVAASKDPAVKPEPVLIEHQIIDG